MSPGSGLLYVRERGVDGARSLGGGSDVATNVFSGAGAASRGRRGLVAGAGELPTRIDAAAAARLPGRREGISWP